MRKVVSFQYLFDILSQCCVGLSLNFPVLDLLGDAVLFYKRALKRMCSESGVKQKWACCPLCAGDMGQWIVTLRLMGSVAFISIRCTTSHADSCTQKGHTSTGSPGCWRAGAIMIPGESYKKRRIMSCTQTFD